MGLSMWNADVFLDSEVADKSVSMMGSFCLSVMIIFALESSANIILQTWTKCDTALNLFGEILTPFYLFGEMLTPFYLGEKHF